MRLGLFGASFDPIHQAHLQIAYAALQSLGLDSVHFITARSNPHKESLLEPELRRALVAQAIAREPRFYASDIELQRGTPSYSIDTLRAYQESYPEAQLYMIMGEDAYNSLPSWKQAEEFSKTDIIVYPRFSNKLRPPIHSFLSQDKVHFLELPILAVSSSLIRELLANPPKDLEDKLSKLVPEDIKNQVYEHYS